jgi:hypothetical protein
MFFLYIHSVHSNYVLYGIAQKFAELCGILCYGIRRNSAKFGYVKTEFELFFYETKGRRRCDQHVPTHFLSCPCPYVHARYMYICIYHVYIRVHEHVCFPVQVCVLVRFHIRFCLRDCSCTLGHSDFDLYQKSKSFTDFQIGMGIFTQNSTIFYLSLYFADFVLRTKIGPSKRGDGNIFEIVQFWVPKCPVFRFEEVFQKKCTEIYLNLGFCESQFLDNIFLLVPFSEIPFGS